jgi:hypothetical protein
MAANLKTRALPRWSSLQCHEADKLLMAVPSWIQQRRNEGLTGPNHTQRHGLRLPGVDKGRVSLPRVSGPLAMAWPDRCTTMAARKPVVPASQVNLASRSRAAPRRPSWRTLFRCLRPGRWSARQTFPGWSTGEASPRTACILAPRSWDLAPCCGFNTRGAESAADETRGNGPARLPQRPGFRDRSGLSCRERSTPSAVAAAKWAPPRRRSGSAGHAPPARPSCGSAAGPS